MKRYQIFISSTYEDLKEERAAVIESVLKSENIPVGMEQFVAATESQFDYIKRIIGETDYYILIIGSRYGSIPEGEEISYTEKEYEYAISLGVPVLAFIHNNPDLITMGKSDKDEDPLKLIEKQKKLADFRKKVAGDKRLVKMLHWESPAALAHEVTLSLVKAIDNCERPGWERGPNEKVGIKLLKRGSFDISKAIIEANNDVFISGSALSSVGSAISEIRYLSENKKLKLLSMNCSNVNVVDSLCKFIDDGSTYESMKAEDERFRSVYNERQIRDKSNIIVRKVNHIMPIAYIGIDLEYPTDKSYIKVQHYLHEKHGSETINYIVKPSDELFAYYREQIDILWRKSIPY